jgi:hypothetical protein
MIRKVALLVSVVWFTVSCSPKNSDGSDATTYSSCSITESNALFTSDRAKDISQCWDGVSYKEQSLAQTWCAGKVSSYIASEYIFGHSVVYRVASTNCP